MGLGPFELGGRGRAHRNPLAGLCPIGMIFVRSKNGLSHNPHEWSSKEDCAAGVEVLYRTLIELARET